MAAKVFVDTNVLLRFTFPTLDHHQECKDHLQRLISQGAQLYISGQVIREFCVHATHPKTFKETETTPLSGERLARLVFSFNARFRVLDENEAVREQFLGLLREYLINGKSMHDANIVATMLAHDVDTLITLNEEDFQRYQNRITVIPPQSNPA